MTPPAKRSTVPDSEMNDLPATPRSLPGSNAGQSNTTENSEETNISPTKYSAKLKTRPSAYETGQLMKNHGLLNDNGSSLDHFPDFAAKVRDIVAPDRSSAMKPESAQKFAAYLDIHKRSNESSFLRTMFPLLMKDGYYVVRERSDFTQDEKDTIKMDGHFYRDTQIDEHVKILLDQEFLRAQIPSHYNDPTFATNLAVALSKEEKKELKNPKPDYTFGLNSDFVPQINDAPIPENIRALLEICPGMEMPFAIVEGKPDRGSPAEAQNQARRGGAVLVHTARSLRASAELLPDISGPDDKSFVFSMTMTLLGVDFWVHWYQGPISNQRYQMSRLAGYQLFGMSNLVAIRKVMHNIVEWGALNRRNDLTDLYSSIHTAARQKHKEKQGSPIKQGQKRKQGDK